MYAIRSSGYAGSIGKYAPPAFRIPRIPTIISTERSAIIPTSRSAPMPRARNIRANWFAFAFSSPYVIRTDSNTTASASGVRSTCCSNSA
ncbi:hypothetical protein D3C76_1617780 [compost metagenome]